VIINTLQILKKKLLQDAILIH